MRLINVNQGLQIRTPAKLNLFLEILGKRPDGFHELETLMVSINLYDTLTFTEEVNGSVELSVSGGRVGQRCVVPTDRSNLVMKAADLLRERAGIQTGVRITLHKDIPVEAGLAGGSTDAAATLVGLNRYWNAGLSNHELHELASKLGSDINFFIPSCTAAICRGRGEKVEPIHVGRTLHFVVAKPITGLSTAAVFSKLDLSQDTKSISEVKQAVKTGNIGNLAVLMHNRLEPIARELNPDVAKMQREFSSRQPIGHMMSGSGTSCFAVCPNRRAALRLAGQIRSATQRPVFVVRSSV